MSKVKRKETVAKILELLDGLDYVEANSVLSKAQRELYNYSVITTHSPQKDFDELVTGLEKTISRCLDSVTRAEVPRDNSQADE